MKNHIAKFIAARLPARVIYWCAIRFGVHCTTGAYSSQVVPDLSFCKALKRFGNDHKVH